jgi:hypothetical protein
MKSLSKKVAVFFFTYLSIPPFPFSYHPKTFVFLRNPQLFVRKWFTLALISFIQCIYTPFCIASLRSNWSKASDPTINYVRVVAALSIFCTYILSFVFAFTMFNRLDGILMTVNCSIQMERRWILRMSKF